jgi:hypothetical protein
MELYIMIKEAKYPFIRDDVLLITRFDEYEQYTTDIGALYQGTISLTLQYIDLTTKEIIKESSIPINNDMDNFDYEFKRFEKEIKDIVYMGMRVFSYHASIHYDFYPAYPVIIFFLKFMLSIDENFLEKIFSENKQTNLYKMIPRMMDIKENDLEYYIPKKIMCKITRLITEKNTEILLDNITVPIAEAMMECPFIIRQDKWFNKLFNMSNYKIRNSLCNSLNSMEYEEINKISDSNAKLIKILSSQKYETIIKDLDAIFNHKSKLIRFMLAKDENLTIYSGFKNLFTDESPIIREAVALNANASKLEEYKILFNDQDNIIKKAVITNKHAYENYPELMKELNKNSKEERMKKKSNHIFYTYNERSILLEKLEHNLSINYFEFFKLTIKWESNRDYIDGVVLTYPEGFNEDNFLENDLKKIFEIGFPLESFLEYEEFGYLFLHKTFNTQFCKYLKRNIKNFTYNEDKHDYFEDLHRKLIFSVLFSPGDQFYDEEYPELIEPLEIILSLNPRISSFEKQYSENCSTHRSYILESTWARKYLIDQFNYYSKLFVDKSKWDDSNNFKNFVGLTSIYLVLLNKDYDYFELGEWKSIFKLIMLTKPPISFFLDKYGKKFISFLQDEEDYEIFRETIKPIYQKIKTNLEEKNVLLILTEREWMLLFLNHSSSIQSYIRKIVTDNLEWNKEVIENITVILKGANNLLTDEQHTNKVDVLNTISQLNPPLQLYTQDIICLQQLIEPEAIPYLLDKLKKVHQNFLNDKYSKSEYITEIKHIINAARCLNFQADLGELITFLYEMDPPFEIFIDFHKRFYQKALNQYSRDIPIDKGFLKNQFYLHSKATPYILKILGERFAEFEREKDIIKTRPHDLFFIHLFRQPFAFITNSLTDDNFELFQNKIFDFNPPLEMFSTKYGTQLMLITERGNDYLIDKFHELADNYKNLKGYREDLNEAEGTALFMLETIIGEKILQDHYGTIQYEVENSHLTLLNLKKFKLEFLPSFIFLFQNLHTLIIGHFHIRYLPAEIVFLKKLKVLELNSMNFKIFLPKQIEWLKKLKAAGCKIILPVKFQRFEHETGLDPFDYLEELNKDVTEWDFKGIM